MSFFGYDTSAPQPRPAQGTQAYEFQDTYEGLGEYEEDDALNSETFGVGEVGKSFDFSSTTRGAAPVSLASATRPNVSFARAAANDDEFMKDLWGDNTPEPSGQQPAGAPQQQQPHADDKKVLSLQEIEAQLTAIEKPHPQGPPQHQYYPGMPAQYGGYMMPQGYGMPYPGHFMPMQHPMMPPQMSMPGMMGGPVQPHMGPGMPQVPQQMQHMAQQPQQQEQQQQPQQQQQLAQQAQQLQMQMQQPQQQQLQPQLQQPHAEQQQHYAQAPQATPPSSQASMPSVAPLTAKTDYSQFPVLGSKGNSQDKRDVRPEAARPLSAEEPRAPEALDSQNDGRQARYSQQFRQPLEELLPEEQQRLARRQEKVAKIMRYSGVMNPKDKDFVTRFQLSQIVTDDPYNEDFYSQVYRVIHPKSTPNALGAPSALELNSIAQAYLDHSGHRLGGRFKRADVALQRMQQQVQKAVTVAKERQKLTPTAKAGVLGKISAASGKKPRQKLVILSKAAQKAQEQEPSEPVSAQKKSRSPSIAAPNKPIKKYTKRDIMCILEEIINSLISVENNSRSAADTDTTSLWESLHVLDQASSSGDDELYVNPFVQCLNYSKALKILPRLFKFLNREQTLTVITLIMSNLENLKVIKDGSYTTYEDKKLPAEIVKLSETYTLTFCKVLMNAVQDFRFNEIIGLLLILVQHNAVSFVSTTKIGLSVLTTLLSRAELIKGEGTISATDLSEWTSCYDELFTALESRIAAIFPPFLEDTEDDYVWQFLATLSLGGKLSHQRIIVDEVRDEIFGVMGRAKAIDDSDLANLEKKRTMLNNLNMYLVVMGLSADENEIQELKY